MRNLIVQISHAHFRDVSGLVLWCWGTLWFDDLRAAYLGDRLNILTVM